jgi:hypothetical protein
MNGVTVMRFFLIAVAATLPLAISHPAKACESEMIVTQAATTEYSAEEAKKPVKMAHKKTHHVKKEKVEYMRAAPM